MLEDGNVRVGVFPKREGFLIGRLGLGGVALRGVGVRDWPLRMRREPSGILFRDQKFISGLEDIGPRDLREAHRR